MPHEYGPVTETRLDILRVQGDAHTIQRDLLAEQLPPETLADIEQFTVPRFATWFDHFCGTYRGRWWAWVIGLDLREIRYIDEAWSHRTEVAVRSRWTYPEARRMAPADQFGPVVLRAETSFRDSGVMPW